MKLAVYLGMAAFLCAGNRKKTRARMRNKRAKDGFRCYDLSPQNPCK